MGRAVTAVAGTGFTGHRVAAHRGQLCRGRVRALSTDLLWCTECSRCWPSSLGNSCCTG